MRNTVFMNGVLFLVLLGLLSGCGATRQARSVEESGFLSEAKSRMRDGENDEALRIYRNEKADWKSYKKMMISPVTVWVGKDSQLEDVTPLDRQRLANDLWSKLNEALKADYEIVQQPGPGVMLVKVAITEGEASWPVIDTISTIVPQMHVLSELKYLATGTASFVGKASGEMLVTDGATGELLLAAADRRAGGKRLRGVASSWDDVEETYRYWAEKSRWRLCKLRGETECVEPKS
ncbi:MAG: DUF3313 domain-containing protein [Nitrospirales bacterium]